MLVFDRMHTRRTFRAQGRSSLYENGETKGYKADKDYRYN